MRRGWWIENSAGGAGGQGGNCVGVRQELRGLSWSLVLCQRGIKVQCVRSFTVPPSLPSLLVFSCKAKSQQTVSRQEKAALRASSSPYILAFKVTQSLRFLLCFCASVKKSSQGGSYPQLVGLQFSTNVWKETSMCKQTLECVHMCVWPPTSYNQPVTRHKTVLTSQIIGAKGPHCPSL